MYSSAANANNFFYFCGMKNIPTILNQDRFLQGMESSFNNCGWRTYHVKEKYGFDAQGGSVFIYTRCGWRSMYGFHFWNVGANGEVIDSYDSFHKGIAEEKRLCEKHGARRQLSDMKDFKYKVIDGSQFKPLKYNDRFNFVKGITMDDYVDTPCPMEKWLNKFIPKGRYDLIYVTNVAYDDHGRLFTPNALRLLHTKYQFDDAEYDLEELIRVAG